MIYILAVLLPPLGLLLNGQPFSAIFSVMLIVFCLIFGILFFRRCCSWCRRSTASSPCT